MLLSPGLHEALQQRLRLEGTFASPSFPACLSVTAHPFRKSLLFGATSEASVAFAGGGCAFCFQLGLGNVLIHADSHGVIKLFVT